MKVRWTSESLRLRITPSELATLAHGEPVTAELTFPDGGGWLIRLAPGGQRLEATASSRGVIVRMPPDDLKRLEAPDTEGVYAHQPGSRLMVEKDFPCAHPHSAEAKEPETERFAPTPAYLARKHDAISAEGADEAAKGRWRDPAPLDFREGNCNALLVVRRAITVGHRVVAASSARRWRRTRRGSAAFHASCRLRRVTLRINGRARPSQLR